jgi:hypothetical protein
MEQDKTNSLPIINCHTHIFTVDDVPPVLAKSIIPSPLYKLVRVGPIAALVKLWTDNAYLVTRQKWYIKAGRILYLTKIALTRYFFVRLAKAAIIIIILASIYYDQFKSLIEPWLKSMNINWPVFTRIYEWLGDQPFIIKTDSWLVKISALILLLVLFPLGRNILFAVLRQTNRFMKLIPGKQTTEILKRYINIVRFANYKEQHRVLSRVRGQYPPGSKMVILPMDMTYMGAGKPPRAYADQMQMLAAIKKNHGDNVFPFVFVDPRRIEEEKKKFFDYKVVGDKVVLEPCFIKDYIEDKNFAGFKIYPALGYFPFDELLLPLWKYAADNGIPLMTHCIRGVIYYRNRKKKEWDYHPVFEQFMGENENSTDDKDYGKMLLPQMKAVDVQEIFTHPLNYICLYKNELLQKLVEKAKDDRVRQIFGFDKETKTIARGLSHLKLCFGHFGGEDEWKQFFEKDRTNFGNHIISHPCQGIDFLYTEGKLKRGKPEQLWKTADWYTIICSLMLQHPYVFADISYILHGDLEIMPLLRSTLQHPELKKRVLYGSDFFVVRNHKSDKNMLADIKGGLLKDEFDQIARKNPLVYLHKASVDEQPDWRPEC